jgi:hypothetical protein
VRLENRGIGVARCKPVATTRPLRGPTVFSQLEHQEKGFWRRYFCENFKAGCLESLSIGSHATLATLASMRYTSGQTCRYSKRPTRRVRERSSTRSRWLRIIARRPHRPPDHRWHRPSRLAHPAATVASPTPRPEEALALAARQATRAFVLLLRWRFRESRGAGSTAGSAIYEHRLADSRGDI